MIKEEREDKKTKKQESEQSDRQTRQNSWWVDIGTGRKTLSERALTTAFGVEKTALHNAKRLFSSALLLYPYTGSQVWSKPRSVGYAFFRSSAELCKALCASRVIIPKDSAYRMFKKDALASVISGRK